MISRRGFCGGALTAGFAGVPAFATALVGGDGIVEPSRTLKVAGSADVVVAGGGPAGIAAAVGAARQGARVILLEDKGTVGGIWTNGLLGCLIGFNRSDFDREILARLDRYRARCPRRPEPNGHNFVYEPEYMKIVCEELLAEAGVRIRLGTRVVAAVRDGRNVRAVVTESKSGREAWVAQRYVDCTGDGDLAAAAGCAYDVGGAGPGDPEQPASLIAVFTLPDDRGILRFVANEQTNYGSTGEAVVDAKAEFRKELERVGIRPSYGYPTIFRANRHLFVLMANHEYDVRVDDADAIGAATMRARREVVELTEALVRESLLHPDRESPWHGLRLVATADQICHRRARRIRGRYTMRVEDCLNGATFADALTTCHFGIDVHAVSKAMNRTRPAGSPFAQPAQPYQLPFRACQAADLDNLYMAGRCISGDFFVQASYRITGTAVALGYGVGERIGREIAGEGKRQGPAVTTSGRELS
ncbi:MAG: FAD-dependent oxidoreductase [Kiritimatiellia bacterium]